MRFQHAQTRPHRMGDPRSIAWEAVSKADGQEIVSMGH
jgi:hypothetical protein